MKGNKSVQASREERRRSFGIGGAGNIRMPFLLLVLEFIPSCLGLVKPLLTESSVYAPKPRQSSTRSSHPSDPSSGAGAAS